MSWRVFATDASQPDVDKLTQEEQAALARALLDWVEHGPPRSNPRDATGVKLYADELPSGLVVTYFINEAVPYVAILRVRRR